MTSLRSCSIVILESSNSTSVALEFGSYTSPPAINTTIGCIPEGSLPMFSFSRGSGSSFGTGMRYVSRIASHLPSSVPASSGASRR